MQGPFICSSPARFLVQHFVSGQQRLLGSRAQRKAGSKHRHSWISSWEKSVRSCMGLPSPKPPCFLASQTNGFLPGTAAQPGPSPSTARLQRCLPQHCHSSPGPGSGLVICEVRVPNCTQSQPYELKVLIPSGAATATSSGTGTERDRDRKGQESCCDGHCQKVPAWLEILTAKVLIIKLVVLIVLVISVLSPLSFEPESGLNMAWSFLE